MNVQEQSQTSEWSQLCLMSSTFLDIDNQLNPSQEKIDEFEMFILDETGCRIKFECTVKTNPDTDKNGHHVPETGGRMDTLFYVHNDDVMKFAMPRFKYGIRWWEDVLGNGNGPLYSKDVLTRYDKTW